MENPNVDLQKLQSLQRIRKFVVYGAIALIALSLVQRMPLFIYGRVALWASAGVLSLLEASALKRLNTKPTTAYFNAAIYFAVSLLPLLVYR